MCLFEECDSPEELYNHSDTWLKHMRKHALRWRCTSKSHIEFVGATRDGYLSHMRAAHPGKLTDAQLGVMADRNGRMVGPLFKSCPLCGIGKVDGSMEDHIVGHLRFLALKSLPSYGEDVEGLEDSESQNSSMATSRPQSRSTIKLELEMNVMHVIHVPLTFYDEGDRASVGLDHGPSRYKAWGGFRKYIGRFPEGQRLPNQTTNSSLLTGATKTPLPPQPLHFELPPLHLPSEGRLASYDPSTEFIEESFFDGVSYKERRLFEWGFIPDAHRSAGALEDDPVLQGFVKRAQKSKPDTYQPPKIDFALDPDCAICNAPARTQCECEAKGFDVAIRQAENKMMLSKFHDIRSWVRGHSQDVVIRDYRRRESSAKVAQPPWTIASPTTQAGPSRQVGNETWTQQEMNEAWRAAVQRYPETLEYYYGLVDLSLPSDDDPAVRNPPLSALSRSLGRSRPRDPPLHASELTRT